VLPIPVLGKSQGEKIVTGSSMALSGDSIYPSGVGQQPLQCPSLDQPQAISPDIRRKVRKFHRTSSSKTSSSPKNLHKNPYEGSISSGRPMTPSLRKRNGRPFPRTTVVMEAMIKPQIMGFRYPHRVRKKLVTAAAEMPPSDLGVKIMPLPSVETP
jgi:hypothetical protein